MSIGQRLLLAFALLLAILGGFAALVHYAYRTAEHEHSVYREQTEPRVQRARTFERTVLYAAISLRNYLAFRDEHYRRLHEQNVAAAQSALRALEDVTRGSPDEAEVHAIRELLDAYLDDAALFARLSLAGERDATVEQQMALDRERMLAQTRKLTESLEARTSHHIAAVGDIMRRNAERVALGTIGALILFAGLCLVVARSIRVPVRRLVDAVREWKRGDHRPALALADATPDRGSHDEIQTLMRAFGDAARAVDRRERRSGADAKICRGIASTLDVAEIGQACLRDIVEHLGAAGALLYRWHEDDAQLTALTGVTLTTASGTLASGEGLPGQAAAQRAPVVLEGLRDEDSLAVRLGYDTVAPSNAIALPLMSRDRLLGVVVVASLKPFDDDARDYLESASTLLAIGLRNAFAHEHIVELLAQMQERNARIQAQSEELQAQNEEIQAQSEELQAQNEEIQSQHEELQAQNEQLVELSESLRAHAVEIAMEDRRKTEFLAVLAHELRNPMAPIVTSLAILRRAGGHDGRSEAALRAIERQSAHLMRLIEDLLDITRISRGKIELQRRHTDLVALIQGCVNDYREAIEAGGITLEARLPDTPAFADIDADRVVQAVGNLLHNAMKFTGKGGRITVSMQRLGQSMEIAVTDTGDGMASTLLAQLFQPFSQGPSGLDRRNGGLGLGLALVKGLVEQHGGRVEAHSDGPGAGSRFAIHLPLVEATMIDDSHSPDARTDADNAGTSTTRYRVLVVDDNLDAAETLRMALEWEGHAVETVHNGLDVHGAANAFRPDVVLCDIGLPGIDGYEVARRLRADPAYAGTLLIALTGYASDSDREATREAGFDVHLAKPLDFERLNQALRQIEPGRRAGTS
jgi:signal transduction histidine kinase/ActR/RegA family two-component response regulator